MQAVRCTTCGETRWSLFGSSTENAMREPCEVCGGRVVPERRRPGAGPRILLHERRKAGPGAELPGVRKPSGVA